MELTLNELDAILSCLNDLATIAYAEGDLERVKQLSDLIEKLREYKEHVCKGKRDN